MAELQEYYAAGETISYPFSDYADGNTKPLIADFYCVHSGFSEVNQQIKLAFLQPNRIWLKNAAGSTFLDLNAAVDPQVVCTGPVICGLYTVYTWSKISTNAAPYLTGTEASIKVVFRSAELAKIRFPIVPTNAFLLPSLIVPKPWNVRKLMLKQPGLPIPLGGGVASGVVRLEAGNNVSIKTSPPAQVVGLGIGNNAPTVRVPTVVVIDVAPGLGTGVLQDCNNDGEVKTINGAGPDTKGNFDIEGSDCVRQFTPIGAIHGATHPNTDYSAIRIKGAMGLADDCLVCCDCTDYGAAYEAITRAWNRALAVAHRIETLREEYNALINILQTSEKQPCPAELSIDLEVLSRPDYHLAVSLTVVNNTANVIPIAAATFCIFPTGWQYTQGSGMLSDEYAHASHVAPAPGGNCSAGTGLQISIPSISVGKVFNYTFSLRYPKKTSRVGTMATVVLSLNSALGTFTQSKGAALEPPLNKT